MRDRTGGWGRGREGGKVITCDVNRVVGSEQYYITFSFRQEVLNSHCGATLKCFGFNCSRVVQKKTTKKNEKKNEKTNCAPPVVPVSVRAIMTYVVFRPKNT